MRALLAATSLFALAACGGEPPAPVSAEGDTATPAAAPAARDGCKDIAALASAMTEAEPFASLRTGNVMLGDQKVDDQFTTDVAPAGAQCKMGQMKGWNAGDPEMFVVNCELFSGGVFDEEENSVKAKTAFDAAKAELDKCLPAGWTARDVGNNGDERTEALIYETAADKARSEGADAYVYPLELRKEYYQGSMRGGRTQGWSVVLNFQASGPAAAAATGETPAAEH
ncbi:MAG: hypothetical protein Q8R82_03820 [Hyphomonadaceae bacterium]|nr:hypothetical protein [Hyphomonadaceae bacterium]